jgi:phosphate transport system protein
VRSDLEVQIEQLRTTVIGMAERADGMLVGALRALTGGGIDAASLVSETDKLVDRAYGQVQHGVLAVIALHRPVGGELRLLTALIHVSLHLERMGDDAASVARTTQRSADITAEPALVDQLAELGALAREVGQRAVAAFVHGDLEAARDVGRLGGAVDGLTAGIFQRLVWLAAADEHRLEWATRMIQVTRHLERYADHGLDVAEQTSFVVTGGPVERSSDD